MPQDITLKPHMSPGTAKVLVWVSWVLLAVPVVALAVLANAPAGTVPWWTQGVLTGLSTVGGLIKAILPAGLMGGSNG